MIAADMENQTVIQQIQICFAIRHIQTLNNDTTISSIWIFQDIRSNIRYIVLQGRI